MKFYAASETAQRHVTEFVERDAREMETLIQTEQDALKGTSDVKKLGYIRRFFRLMGKLSDEWNIFDTDVFNVRLTIILIGDSLEFT